MSIFSLQVILYGWLGSKRQLTNSLTHCPLVFQELVLAWSTCQLLWQWVTGSTRSEHLPQDWLCAELVSVPSSSLPWVSTWSRSMSGGGLTSSLRALSSTVQSVVLFSDLWIKSNPGGRLTSLENLWTRWGGWGWGGQRDLNTGYVQLFFFFF